MKHLNKLGCLAVAMTVVSIMGLPRHCAGDEDSGLYVGLDAGVNLMGDIEVEGGSMKVDPGWRVDAEMGYRLNEYASVGFEAGFLYNQPEQHSDGEWLGQVPLLAKVVFRYENESKFVPYIGAGAGGALFIAAYDYDSGTGFAFAWQAEAGVRYKLGENTSVGVAYKYFGVADNTVDFGDFELEFSNLHSHMIGASFNWSF